MLRAALSRAYRLRPIVAVGSVLQAGNAEARPAQAHWATIAGSRRSYSRLTTP